MSTLSTIEIPIAEDTFYQVQVFLDEEKYNLRFRWNRRNETWYMDVFDIENNPILYSQPCLAGGGGMTYRFFITDLMPYGDILTLDINGLGKDPTFEDFGDKTGPFYVSVFDELPQ